MNCIYDPFILDLGKILAAFILTTVIGSFLTYRFQSRSWKHQRKVLIADRYDDKATEIFEDISGILDQRLFRYRQIIYMFRTEDEVRIEKAFAEYREVLFRWNDKINRNYSMLEKFFGKEMRKKLETDINRDIIFIGTLLERVKHNADTEIGTSEIWKKIDIINASVYQFDLAMLEIISEKSKDVI